MALHEHKVHEYFSLIFFLEVIWKHLENETFGLAKLNAFATSVIEFRLRKTSSTAQQATMKTTYK
jgi:hypothetical protein